MLTWRPLGNSARSFHTGNEFSNAQLSLATGSRKQGRLITAKCNEQAGDREVHRFGTPDRGAPSSAQPLQEAALPKGRLLFALNSVKLTARNRKSLECAAAWLRKHPIARVLIVGFCDDSGSEACAAALAERRAEVVR
jgi:outer membrane protein OmpA-like peptidoglycan-associated protein